MIVVLWKEWIGGYKQWEQGDALGGHGVVQAGDGGVLDQDNGLRPEGGHIRADRHLGAVQETCIGRSHGTS